MKHHCILEDGTTNHVWQVKKDWYGDMDVINGTETYYYQVCKHCGEEDMETRVTAQDFREQREDARFGDPA